ncbi:hypothetical protein IAU60_005477 [Kwoniella sp. DSM 27419]
MAGLDAETDPRVITVDLSLPHLSGPLQLQTVDALGNPTVSTKPGQSLGPSSSPVDDVKEDVQLHPDMSDNVALPPFSPQSPLLYPGNGRYPARTTRLTDVSGSNARPISAAKTAASVGTASKKRPGRGKGKVGKAGKGLKAQVMALRNKTMVGPVEGGKVLPSGPFLWHALHMLTLPKHAEYVDWDPRTREAYIPDVDAFATNVYREYCSSDMWTSFQRNMTNYQGWGYRRLAVEGSNLKQHRITVPTLEQIADAWLAQGYPAEPFEEARARYVAALNATHADSQSAKPTLSHVQNDKDSRKRSSIRPSVPQVKVQARARNIRIKVSDEAQTGTGSGTSEGESEVLSAYSEEGSGVVAHSSGSFELQRQSIPIHRPLTTLVSSHDSVHPAIPHTPVSRRFAAHTSPFETSHIRSWSSLRTPNSATSDRAQYPSEVFSPEPAFYERSSPTPIFMLATSQNGKHCLWQPPDQQVHGP